MNQQVTISEVIRNILIGLTVSFVAISLGSALGSLSGRGAFAGMISAGIIAFVTSVIGGTRVQCSGPTAPMSAISAIVVAYAFDSHLSQMPDFNADHFINIVFILMSVILLLLGIFRFGKFIRVVPNVVISGFMSGIAVLIWISQINTLFGLQGVSAIQGDMVVNLMVVLATLILTFGLPVLFKLYIPSISSFIPVALVVVVVVSVCTNLLSLNIEYVNISTSISSVSDFTDLLVTQWPTNWSSNYIMAALPFALQLATLCYLDTLLTALVVDKMSNSTTRQNKELIAQGIANTSAALVGGIAGAQATIRSVLMLKEGATLRIAGIFVGIFVILEMLIFQHAIMYIPQAVFTGILIKVGYDIFDYVPIRLYLHEILKGKIKITENIFKRHDHDKIFVTNMEMLFIIGTILTTVLVDLNVAVVGLTVMFYVINKLVTPNNPMRDLSGKDETEGVSKED